ncbi:hypothetical protein D9758_006467 [Tetrapyrgos nigripes]|uniref:Uncharacterized protein n=1 Tax=Tetrapyrgos nigripes TaxID=182062 RepID=A0A8H5GL55_9AGAR|nr:hypothetical protein D9758_006467 [Tetrapyrgos nigripes]
MADELSSTAIAALSSLSPTQKAEFLLNISLSLISAGQYGVEVERYLDVYLRTPNLPKDSVAKALLARADARKLSAEKLLERAKADYQAVLRIDSGKEAVNSYTRMRMNKVFGYAVEPPWTHTPAEIWTMIARYIPRYHLRTWLSVSSFHRSIALPLIFHTLDLHFGEDSSDHLNRGLDILDKAKTDEGFARLVKSLRIHWAFEEGDMLDLMIRTFKGALPAFKELKDFEWIGYPEMRADSVKTLLGSHPKLQGLGSIGWHFDAMDVSHFKHLTKFTLRAEDDDGDAPMDELPRLLTANSSTLRHLIFSAYLHRPHSWDEAFNSPSIQNLTYLDLCDTRISTMVLNRLMGIQGLKGLTLHGTFEDWKAARVVFGGDYKLGGKHVLLPELESFRFVMMEHPSLPGLAAQGLVPVGVGAPLIKAEETALYESVIRFLRNRPKLRRLDLGGCPWELISGEAAASLGASSSAMMPSSSSAPSSYGFGAGVVFDSSFIASEPDPDSHTSLLTSLSALRVLHISFTNLTAGRLRSLVEVLPEQMVALSISVGSPIASGVTEKSLHEYVIGVDGEGNTLSKLRNLTFLHLREERLVGRGGRGAHATAASGAGTTGASQAAGLHQINQNQQQLQHQQQPQAGPSYLNRPRRLHPHDQDAHRTNEQTEADPEIWVAQARSVACRMPSLDFLGWHGEHYVVVRNGSGMSSGSGKGKELHPHDSGFIKPSPSPVMGSHFSPFSYPSTHAHGHGHGRPYPHIRPYPSPVPLSETAHCTPDSSGLCPGVHIDLKELPPRRRLDCGKGVDLGGEDAAWLERKDVPVDYEEPGL